MPVIPFQMVSIPSIPAWKFDCDGIQMVHQTVVIGTGGGHVVFSRSLPPQRAQLPCPATKHTLKGTSCHELR